MTCYETFLELIRIRIKITMCNELKRMNRRKFIKIVAFASLIPNLIKVKTVMADHGKIEKITLSKKEWQEKLSEEEFRVLRKEGTEPSFSSPLNSEKRDGLFVCAGCDLPLFKSSMKYDSGTGWPSFWDTIDGHIETKRDYKLIIPRTEYHCARCGGHQGHVFDDGPKPTGLRYCNNGVALKFIPKDQI